MKFAKGHGTQNDFVVLPDLDAAVALTPAAVAALCDRRRGIGADGVLRVTTAAAALAAGVFDRIPEGVGGEDWYMDYRNADGSIAQMLRQRRPSVRALPPGVPGSSSVTSSSSGLSPARVPSSCTRSMTCRPTSRSKWERPTTSVPARRSSAGRRFNGLAVDVGNPHLACVDASLTEDDLSALDVAAPVSFDAARFPDGVNVEVLTAPVDGAVSMRVHERGVGETRSCGTGTVAAVVAALRHSGDTTGTLRVHVPGGEVDVTITDSTSYLRGPSVLLAHGDISDEWWQAQER